jgi:hypothetical protein
MSVHRVSRRGFLQSVAGAAVAAPFLSRGIRAAQTVRHASIGSSGQAFSDIMSFAEHPAFDLVAIADVDLCKVDEVLMKFPKVRVYQDWRELLKKERDHVDSVSVSTPDHMHCIVAVEALKRNKPVYVQKPLCNTLHEVRLLTDLARKRGLTTQDGHSGVVVEGTSATAKRWCEAASSARSRKSTRSRTRAGATSSRWSIAWMQCRRRSTGISGSASRRRVPSSAGVYHPGEWRRRVGFGTGTLGDMGCHIYSPPYRALGLTVTSQRDGLGPGAGRGELGKAREGQADRTRARSTPRATRWTSGGTTAGRCRRPQSSSQWARACLIRGASSSVPTGSSSSRT